MVPVLEVAFLIICALLGLWWFSRTKAFRYRAHGGKAADPGSQYHPPTGMGPPAGPHK